MVFCSSNVQNEHFIFQSVDSFQKNKKASSFAILVKQICRYLFRILLEVFSSHALQSTLLCTTQEQSGLGSWVPKLEQLRFIAWKNVNIKVYASTFGPRFLIYRWIFSAGRNWVSFFLLLYNSIKPLTKMQILHIFV